MSLAVEMAYGLWSLIRVQGAAVIYTSVTTIPNAANPAPNPPTILSPIVAAPASMGDTTIDFSAAVLTGRLIAGDSFTVPGDPTIYVVSAPVISPVTAQTLSDVPFEPPLAEDVAQGVIPTFAYTSTYSLKALVTDFPAHLINGESIQSKDHKVRFLISGVLPGAATPSLPNIVIPIIGDLIALPDGEVQKVIRISHLETQGQHYGYAVQVRA